MRLLTASYRAHLSQKGRPFNMPMAFPEVEFEALITASGQSHFGEKTQARLI